jgi:bacteriorhodopsin
MVRQSSLEEEFARAISTNATGGIHLCRSNCASTLHNGTFIHYHPAIIHFTLTISNNNKQASKQSSQFLPVLLSLVQCTAYCLIGYHPVRIDKKTVNYDRQVTRGD